MLLPAFTKSYLASVITFRLSSVPHAPSTSAYRLLPKYHTNSATATAHRLFGSKPSSEMTSPSQTPPMVVDPFAFRQFSESEASATYGGAVFSTSVAEFEKIANSKFEDSELRDGYAPFCKHLFIDNDFSDARVNVVKITPENEHLLRCGYEARNEKELPVLSRYFPKESISSTDLPVAKYLDIILYSREQIDKETAAMGKSKATSDSPWGIVSIKAQDVDRELPMTPITAMRNALGKEEGGSGIQLDREAYMEAFQYWSEHANLS